MERCVFVCMYPFNSRSTGGIGIKLLGITYVPMGKVFIGKKIWNIEKEKRGKKEKKGKWKKIYF